MQVSPSPAERLEFVLPEFLRVCWVSDGAREAWAPKLRAIVEAWEQIEIESVTRHVRPCALIRVSPSQYAAALVEWRSHNLDAAFVESSPGVTARMVIGAPRDVERFQSAWGSESVGSIGELLGYPGCCSTAFARRCAEHQVLDHLWTMATEACRVRDTSVPGHFVGSASVPALNMLWRYVGLRAVPHMPCGVDCTSSLELAGAMAAVGTSIGREMELRWLEEVLSWPVEWSALHGIAEIRTPILKIATRTDATANKLIVRWEGERYPSDGARGLAFPYRTVTPGIAREANKAAGRSGAVIPLRPVSTPPRACEH